MHSFLVLELLPNHPPDRMLAYWRLYIPFAAAFGALLALYFPLAIYITIPFVSCALSLFSAILDACIKSARCNAIRISQQPVL